MRREVWIDDAIGNVTIVLSDGDEVKAIYWCDEDYETEIVERFKELVAESASCLRMEKAKTSMVRLH